MHIHNSSNVHSLALIQLRRWMTEENMGKDTSRLNRRTTVQLVGAGCDYGSFSFFSSSFSSPFTQGEKRYGKKNETPQYIECTTLFLSLFLPTHRELKSFPFFSCSPKLVFSAFSFLFYTHSSPSSLFDRIISLNSPYSFVSLSISPFVSTPSVFLSWFSPFYNRSTRRERGRLKFNLLKIPFALRIYSEAQIVPCSSGNLTRDQGIQEGKGSENQESNCRFCTWCVQLTGYLSIVILFRTWGRSLWSKVTVGKVDDVSMKGKMRKEIDSHSLFFRDKKLFFLSVSLRLKSTGTKRKNRMKNESRWSVAFFFSHCVRQTERSKQDERKDSFVVLFPKWWSLHAKRKEEGKKWITNQCWWKLKSIQGGYNSMSCTDCVKRRHWSSCLLHLSYWYNIRADLPLEPHGRNTSHIKSNVTFGSTVRHTFVSLRLRETSFTPWYQSACF